MGILGNETGVGIGEETSLLVAAIKDNPGVSPDRVAAAVTNRIEGQAGLNTSPDPYNDVKMPGTGSSPAGGGSIDVDLSSGTLTGITSGIHWVDITLKSAQIDGDYASLNAENCDANIKLLLKPGDISDGVNVSMTRRWDSDLPIGSTINSIMTKLGLAELGNIASFKYDASSLAKTISLNFVYPYSNSKYDATTMRKMLSNLQGVVYPRGYGFLYPPLLSLTVGDLYKGFYGFITAVDIVFKEDWTEKKGTYPLWLEGTIKFQNLFNYYWGEGGGSSFNFKNGAVLFESSGGGGGSGSGSGAPPLTAPPSTSGADTGTGTTTPSPMSPEALKQLADQQKKVALEKGLNIEDNKYVAQIPK